MANEYSRAQYAFPHAPQGGTTKSSPGSILASSLTSSQYSGGLSWQQPSPYPPPSSSPSIYSTQTYNYRHLEPIEYSAPQPACPPGCNCGYDYSLQQQQQQTYASYPPVESSSEEMIWGTDDGSYQSYNNNNNNNNNKSALDSHIIKNPADPQPPDECGKYPFPVIIQEIIRGIAGDHYADNADPTAFCTKLDSSETQRMSGLCFFNSFTQRDVNLQCTLLSQVIHYWSLEGTTPDLSAQDGGSNDYSGKSRSRSPRSPREGNSSKRKSRRGPPPPRYWSRLENAAVVGLMLGLPLDLLKVVLEKRTHLNLGAVDAILDTNSAEVGFNPLSFYFLFFIFYFFLLL